MPTYGPTPAQAIDIADATPELRFDDPGLHAAVENTNARLLLTRNTPPAALGVPLALLLVLLLWPEFDHGTLLVWLTLKTVSAGIRLLCYVAWRRKPDIRPARTWSELYTWLLALDGFVWSLLAGAVVDLSNTLYAAIVVATLLGVCAAGLIVLSSNFKACLVFSFSLLLPVILSFVSLGGHIGLFASGALLVFLLVVITDCRRTARELDELLRLRYGTAVLAAEREQALRQAEANSQVKGRFLATMSHEMRTPLHGMLGMLELILNRSRPPAELEDLRLIQKSGQHLLGLINDILDVTKIEADGLQLESDSFDLDFAIREIVDMQRSQALAKGLALRAESTLGEDCWLEGDQARVRQILFNLIGNALKFTRAGEVTVTAKVEDGILQIAVRDTGIGISADALPFVFDAFTQAHIGSKESFGGTGLGLNISRQLAQAMGGDLVCESTLNVGSIFTLTLPWKPGMPAVRPPESADVAEGLVPRSGSRILVADDNEVNLLIVESMLAKLGMSVVTARNGAEAVKAYLEVPPDLILMDCQMPVLDGLAATRAIRMEEEQQGKRHVPIVAVSASAFAEDRAAFLAAGMDQLLAKPFTEDDLGRVLGNYLAAPAA